MLSRTAAERRRRAPDAGVRAVMAGSLHRIDATCAVDAFGRILRTAVPVGERRHGRTRQAVPGTRSRDHTAATPIVAHVRMGAAQPMVRFGPASGAAAGRRGGVELTPIRSGLDRFPFAWAH